MVVDNIQREIFQGKRLKPGDYSVFANQIENLFVDPTIMALDEYGLPIQIARKLIPYLEPDGNLDNVLGRLKNLKAERLPISEFEKEFIIEVQKCL